MFVNDADAAARAEAALRAAADGRYTVLTRAELDALGAMPGAALGLEAAPGWAIGASCDRGLTEPGVALERARLIDVAPTAARLLGIPAPPVEGRVLEEILR